MKENKDYEIIPSADDTDFWEVRILTGDFTETVIRYGAIAFNEIADHMTFNFNIISSPAIVDADNENLQNIAGLILQSIIEEALSIDKDSIELKDRETGEYIKLP